MKRKQLIVIHTVLAAFFLPMGVMYAITGGLYGLGVKGAYDTATHELALDEPLPSELSGLVALAERELATRGLEPPSGKAGVKKGGTSYYLEWTGSRRDVQIHPTADPREATLKIKETNAHRFFVQLHKAKGGTLFKQYAAVWATGLVLLFLSGGAMALTDKQHRKMALGAAAVGVVVFAAMAWIN
ncbi:MAG: hypothetical protein ACYTGP_06030 [Planctomycetota bacterium]